MRKVIPCMLLASLSLGALGVYAQTAPATGKAASTKTASATQGTRYPTLTKMTAAEVSALIRSEAKDKPRALESLATDPEQRLKVLENFKQALAVAAEASSTGYTEDANIQMQLNLARIEVLASVYNDKLKADGGKPFAEQGALNYVDPKHVEAFFAHPVNQTKFAQQRESFLLYIEGEQKKNNIEASAEQKASLNAEWEKVLFASAKAIEAKLETPAVQLNYQMQQALLLARGYSQDKLKDQLTPTDSEIDAFMTSDPRFDTAPMRKRAEELAAKAKAGGDFAALANTHTEDPGNRGENGILNGGLYDWRRRQDYVTEFSNASWALEEGQVSDLVETQFGYHILKLEGKRVQRGANGKDEQQVKVRHILIATTYKDPKEVSEVYQMSMRDAASAELSKQKRLKVLGDIIRRNPIDLPVDFQVGPASVNAASSASKKVPAARKKPVRRSGAAKKKR